MRELTACGDDLQIQRPPGVLKRPIVLHSYPQSLPPPGLRKMATGVYSAACDFGGICSLEQGRPSHRPSLLTAVASGAPEYLLRIGSVAGHYHNPFPCIWRYLRRPGLLRRQLWPACTHAIRSVIGLPLLRPPLGTVPDRDKPAAICAFFGNRGGCIICKSQKTSTTRGITRSSVSP